MPLVKRSCLEEIRLKVSILDVVSPYVTLQRAGNNWKGLSPFNNEKTPSFYVHPEKNFFKCFSSGYAGDIFRFIQLKENLPFPEAIETIAHRFNIPLEYEDEGAGAPKEERSLRKELFEIHEIATDFFHQAFLGSTNEGSWIRKYWTEGRHFSLECAKKYSIGLAPTKGNHLQQVLLKHKFSLEALQQCGLFYADNRKPNPLDWLLRFRGRLMVPIRDIQGRPLAFTARQLEITPKGDPAYEAKYINSPETPIFMKRNVLFGLDHARQHINNEQRFLLVEGQLDAIRCWESNLPTAVAPQGTSITQDQLNLLKRYASKITCFLDGDSAGQKAALRLLPMALEAGLEPSFLPLPPSNDPDSFLRTLTPDAIELYMSREVRSAMHFTVDSLFPKGSSLSAQDKVNAVENIFQIVSHAESSLIQDESLDEVAQLTHINRQSLNNDFIVYIRKHNRSKRPFTRDLNTSPSISLDTQNKKLTSVEYQLILILLNNEEIANQLAQIINPEWITTESIYSTLLNRLLAEMREGVWAGSDKIDELLENDAERDTIYALLIEQPPFEDFYKTANICLKKIFIQFINDRKSDIDQQIARADKSDVELLQRLQQERIKLRKAAKSPPTIRVNS